MKSLIPGLLVISLLGMATSAQAGNPEHLQRLIKTNGCPKCDLQGTDLTALDLRQANLQGANLSKANLNLADLTEANLANAILIGASLVWTDFTAATLDGADFSQAIIAGGDRWGRAFSFEKATLMDGKTAHP